MPATSRKNPPNHTSRYLTHYHTNASPLAIVKKNITHTHTHIHPSTHRLTHVPTSAPAHRRAVSPGAAAAAAKGTCSQVVGARMEGRRALWPTKQIGAGMVILPLPPSLDATKAPSNSHVWATRTKLPGGKGAIGWGGQAGGQGEWNGTLTKPPRLVCSLPLVRFSCRP